MHTKRAKIQLMNERLVPNHFIADGNRVTFRDIHRTFSNTELGQALAKKTRYDRYKPEEDKPEEVKNKEWMRLLGADVNNLEHMHLTHNLTRLFIHYNENPLASWTKPIPADAQFNQRESEDLLLTAIVHDWGEAVTGDKMFDLKKDSDEVEELEIMHEISQDLYGGGENTELLGRIRTVLTDVLPNRSSKLGKAFNAIERIGYLRTGLRAWDLSHTQNEEKQELTTGLQWLTNNVLLNQIPALVEYAQLYPAVHAYLTQNSDRISSAFNDLPDSVFDKYKDEINEKRSSFEQAQKSWQNFIAAQPIIV